MLQYATKIIEEIQYILQGCWLYLLDISGKVVELWSRIEKLVNSLLIFYV